MLQYKPDTDSCRYCVFWHIHKDRAMGPLTNEGHPTDYIGTCKRYPRNEVTVGKNWCGEFHRADS